MGSCLINKHQLTQLQNDVFFHLLYHQSAVQAMAQNTLFFLCSQFLGISAKVRAPACCLSLTELIHPQ
jgi:hypothetical protein